MKTTIRRMSILLTTMMLFSANLFAQNVKIDDKELYGVWIMESMQHDGEKKIMCGKETGYTQLSIMGQMANMPVLR